MGTRSLTRFWNNHPATKGSKPFMCIYRQFDGYPSGNGAELARILRPMTVVNGYSLGMKAGTHANGMGCLAAQVIAKLKKSHGIGGIYVEDPKTRNCGEDWVYDVYSVLDRPHIRCLRVTGSDKSYRTHCIYNLSVLMIGKNMKTIKGYS